MGYHGTVFVYLARVLCGRRGPDWGYKCMGDESAFCVAGELPDDVVLEEDGAVAIRANDSQ
eukprot:4045688-Pyramimonas_sp.AAC.1